MPQKELHISILGWTLLLIALSIGLYTLSTVVIYAGALIHPLFGALTASSKTPESNPIDLIPSWNAPNQTPINDLDAVVDGTGTYGFIFNSSDALRGNDYYGGYNWCNMPHVNPETYIKAPAEYVLEYVEVIHRHHKRTPYASNLLPHEQTPWNCTDTNPSDKASPSTSNATCNYPQLTPPGLHDAHQHGIDLFSIYHTFLNFLPSHPTNSTTIIRVTNNPLTTQTANALLLALFPTTPLPLFIQPATLDSLEPSYPCPHATTLYNTHGPSSSNPNWTAHLTRTQALFTHLDSISRVDPNDKPWHQSFDHYFDNLSARLCHSLPLPCSTPSTSPANCINDTSAAQVFRLGEYEYSYLYRDHPFTLEAAAASFGIYIGEVAQNLRSAMSDEGGVKYRHNVAHDGSLAKLLAVLQVDEMVWPGMGSEVVFELFKKVEGDGKWGWFVRVLWGGEVLRSASPALGVIDLVPVERVLGYFDELVGVAGEKVEGLCAES